MSDEKPRVSTSDNGAFAKEVGQQETRKLEEQRRGPAPILSGFAMFGIIGWSIAIPTLLGAALGRWLDHRAPSGRSWTLTMLVAGLALGCANAWRWVSREQKKLNSKDRHE